MSNLSSDLETISQPVAILANITFEKFLYKAQDGKAKSSIPVSDPQVATSTNKHEALGKYYKYSEKSIF